MLRVFILLCLVAVLLAQTCFNGGVYGGSQFNKCYHYFYLPLTQEDAEQICSYIGFQLVSIANAFEQNFIFGHARQTFVLNDYWIGLTDLAEPGTFSWSDGSPFTYKNWMPGNLSRDPYDNCVATRLNSGYWYNTNCDTTKKYFVCQTKPEVIVPAENATACSVSSVKYDARDKCFFFLPSQRTYSEAELMCGGLQGVLTSIADANEMTFVTAHARGKFDKDYWLGLNDFFGYQQWQWADEIDFSYTHWAAGFPSNNTNEMCVAARRSRGEWYNRECEKDGRYFVCSSEALRVPKPSPPPPTTTTMIPATCPAAPTCPPTPTCPAPRPVPSCPLVPAETGWVYFYYTRAWYKVIPHTSWEDAEAECVKMGAHLTSIHSYVENEFVFGLGEGQCTQMLIGLKSYVGDLVTFRWSDRTDMDFNRWVNGGPPSVGDKYYCGYLNDNQWWYNLLCNYNYGNGWCAVCKKM